jgi:hypothetical protein
LIFRIDQEATLFSCGMQKGEAEKRKFCG